MTFVCLPARKHFHSLLRDHSTECQAELVSASSLPCHWVQVHIIPEGFDHLQGLAGEYPLGSLPLLGGLLIMFVLDYVATVWSMRHEAKKQQGLPTGRDCASPAATGETDADAEFGDPSRSGVVPSLKHSHGVQPLSPTASSKQQVVCLSTELGCIFHSVVLGVDLGVITDSYSLLVTFIIAMSVHQAVEGFALGSVLAATVQLSKVKQILLAVCYALTLPLGIVVGIGVSGSYDPESLTSKVVQGVLNSVSGGLLLHVSLYSLLGVELSKPELLQQPRLAVLVGLAVLLGMAIMCVLAIWG